jgi:peptide-methionine (R)-S-oxide reductase
MNRRHFLYGSAGAAALLAGGPALPRLLAGSEARAETFEVTRTDAEWHKVLTPEQYNILREEGTEPPFSSALLNEHRVGVFHCAGCDLGLYSSKTKFDSGTGWPSFWEALPDAVGTKTDTSLFMARVEVHCRRCGGHLGHVFDDGPPPTGKRHCIDGLALTFKPDPSAASCRKRPGRARVAARVQWPPPPPAEAGGLRISMANTASDANRMVSR